MMRILGIGNALVDVLTIVGSEEILKKFDLPKGSMQLVDRDKSDLVKSGTLHCRRILTAGGSAANTIHGLSMLGIQSGFIGSIGKDETGDFFEKEMKDAGVNTFLIRRDSVTGTAVALITPDSERTFATHLGAAVEIAADDLKPAMFEDYDILYFEGYLINDYRLVDSACRMAKEKGMLVSMDLSSYNVVEANLDNFRKIAENYVDILFANELEARAFTGTDLHQALTHMSSFSEVVILKVGPEGSILKKGEEVIKVSALPVRCKDTTGAGDLYAAGFLYGFAMGLNLEKCGKIGSLMAGKVIENIGARMNARKFAEIKKSISRIIREN
ncbi:MAG: adenosine kinase [Bacteroidota bacterium]|nr:adenosine kinase [Bacteroidota bacterium]